MSRAAGTTCGSVGERVDDIHIEVRPRTVIGTEYKVEVGRGIEQVSLDVHVLPVDESILLLVGRGQIASLDIGVHLAYGQADALCIHRSDIAVLELDEDTVMMDALDAGAEDFSPDGPVFEITTDPDSFNDVVKALEDKGYTFESAEIEMVPQNYVTMTSEDDVKSMNKLIDMLEDNEDVQNVWHNWQQD